MTFQACFPGYRWCVLFPLVQDMEAAVVQTIEAGHMTKDLAICIHGSKATADQYLTTEPFMDKVAEAFAALRAGKAKL